MSKQNVMEQVCIYTTALNQLNNSRDTEMVHIEADEILTRVLLILGKELDLELTVGNFIASYEKLPKWYA